MVKIRLSRGGTTKRPFYHIVVTDRRNRRDGRYLERLGFFNPIAAGAESRLQVDLGRFQFWTARGALPSERVAALVSDYKPGDAQPPVKG
jgi:small subunit ribosomal protein S16